MREKLDLLIRAGNPVICVETRDEDGAVAIIRKLAEDTHRPLFEWSVTSGMNQTVPKFADIGVKSGKVGPALEYVLEHTGSGKELYLFKDIAAHAKDATVARLIRDIYAREDVCAILVDSDPLPETVRRLCIPLPMPLPTAEELEHVIRDVYNKISAASLAEIKVSLTKKDLIEMAGTLRGMTAAEAARVIASAIHDDDALTREDLPRLVEAKRNRLQSTGCLESVAVNVAVHEIGGLGRLKQWLARRRGGMTPQALQFGIDPPRGILLLGVQGCGKSLCAKAVAADWTMPLLRLDPGVLYQKFVGESESRLREALAQAEAMAPVVLWVDEIEKAFASAAAESADGGLSQRIFGTLLSWMQDHHHPIFMVATANNITALPPELMRKGRFDEVFFVDLPDAAARTAVWSVHLTKRKRDPRKFRLDELAAAAEGFSGAEIEQAVVSGLYAAFAGNRDLTTEDLTAECKSTRPLSVLMAEKIAALRQWAEGRCVPAD